jgi:hypothetical protein
MVRVILLKTYLGVKYWSLYHLLNFWFFSFWDLVGLHYSCLLLFFDCLFGFFKACLLSVIFFDYWLSFGAHLSLNRIPIAIVLLRSVHFPNDASLTAVPFHPNLRFLLLSSDLLIPLGSISGILRGLTLFLGMILADANGTRTHLPPFGLHPNSASWLLPYQSFTRNSL